MDKNNLWTSIFTILACILITLSNIMTYNSTTVRSEATKRGIIEKVGYDGYLELIGDIPVRAEQRRTTWDK